MKVLNLYSGLGGNRKLWTGVDVVAVESDEKIAEIYQQQNPGDKVIIGDAHQYLVDHYHEFDFIWSSPPCQSHSKMNKATRHKSRRYPDMKLYEEILFLSHFFDGKFVVENVQPYYTPLIDATKVGRHLFWANFKINAEDVRRPDGFINLSTKEGSEKLKEWLGIHYDGNIYYEKNHCPAQVLRNCVHPRLGLQVFNSATSNGEVVDK